MALELIPSDPRTWADFADPSSRGFVKIDCDTAREGALSGGALALAVVAAIWAWGVLDPVHVPAVLRLPPAALNLRGPIVLACVAAALFGLRLMTDDFYLVDRQRHAVFFHAQFGLWRRVRLLIERKDIVTVSVQTRWRADPGDNLPLDAEASHAWWEYRVVLIDSRGRIAPFGDWERDGLWASNNQARDLAQTLQCRCFEAPERSALVVTRVNGEVVVKFTAVRWFTQPGVASWLTAIVSFLFIAVCTAGFLWW
jgi:hypothetical protein